MTTEPDAGLDPASTTDSSAPTGRQDNRDVASTPGDADERTFPLKEYLGFQIERYEGRAVAALTLNERHHNPNAVAHGAVPFALMDTAMGAAVMTVVDDGKKCATVEIHTRFFASVSEGALRAEAVVLSAGRRIVHLEAKTTDATGRLVASATGSFAVIEPRGN